MTNKEETASININKKFLVSNYTKTKTSSPGSSSTG